ncbi:MAG: DsrE/DsrF/DrsH-like family protein, partial [Alphaproteobacteria bacterium]|nr:DsrE/DsrF/DrsH-like family protein [Alphaproteobacteria bacterium]
MSAVDKLSIVVFSGGFERVHYALVMAAAAIASNTPVTLFFTMGAARALLAPDGWRRLPTEEPGLDAQAMDAGFASRGVATFEELLSACVALGVKVMVCEMGLRALNIDQADLRPDVPVDSGGVVTFLADASRDGGMLF